MPGRVRVGTQRGDGFTMEKRQPGCVTGTARPGCAPRAGNPSITDTPLLSTDSMELHWCFESVPSSCELRGAPARESWALLHANLAQPVHRGPSVMPLEEGQEGALSRAQGLGFQVVFVLLSTPSPAASSPSGLLKGLYSEPEAAQGLQAGNQRRPSPATRGAEPAPQAPWAQTGAAPAFLPFAPFHTEVGPGGANPVLLLV